MKTAMFTIWLMVTTFWFEGPVIFLCFISCLRCKYSLKQLSSFPYIFPDPSAQKGKEIPNELIIPKTWSTFDHKTAFLSGIREQSQRTTFYPPISRFQPAILLHRALLTLSMQKSTNCARHGTYAEYSSHQEWHALLLNCWTVNQGDNLHLTTLSSLKNIKTSLGRLPWTLTSSTVSSCGVAALSSESFWEPASALLRTSLLFLCLWASFLTCPSAFPLLRRLTGLVSHFLKVFPGRLGPGELCAPIMWGWSDVTEAGGLASLLETERESEKRMRGAF